MNPGACIPASGIREGKRAPRTYLSATGYQGFSVDGDRSTGNSPTRYEVWRFRHTGCHFNLLRIKIRVEMKLRSPKNIEYSRGSPRVQYTESARSIPDAFRYYVCAFPLRSSAEQNQGSRSPKNSKKGTKRSEKKTERKELEKLNMETHRSRFVDHRRHHFGPSWASRTSASDESRDASSPAKTADDSLAGTNFWLSPSVTLQRVSNRAAMINLRFRNSQPAPPALV
jgi:hypothetical protein